MRLYSPRTEPVLWGVEISETDSFGALQAGARGILKKTLPIHVIVDCLRAVANGNIWIERSVSYRFVGFINRRPELRLTAREEEVLHLVMRGMKNKQIAQTLQISPGTVKVHLTHVFDKTGAKDRFELAMYGRQRDRLRRPRCSHFLACTPELASLSLTRRRIHEILAREVEKHVVKEKAERVARPADRASIELTWCRQGV
jgi:DNA-binding CsgD family transcriptional regulator